MKITVISLSGIHRMGVYFILTISVQLLIIDSLAVPFTRAPGELFMKIKSSELIEGCPGNKCNYVMDICIGIGRSIEERCVWYEKKGAKGTYDLDNYLLSDINFRVDNVKSTLFFNANMTVFLNNKLIKREEFKNQDFSYNDENHYQKVLFSTTFYSMNYELQIKCQQGFYPKENCSKRCFETPGVYSCDSNGQKRCSKGYIFNGEADDCFKDHCFKSICHNGGKCLNEKYSFKCQCINGYTGITCDKWDPCQSHQCKNSASCTKRMQQKDYVCQCRNNYHGQFCEKVIDPCLGISCPKEKQCIVVGDNGECVFKNDLSTKTTEQTVKPTLSSTTLGQLSTTIRIYQPINFIEKNDLKKTKMPDDVANGSFQNAYLILAVSLFIFIFMIIGFGVIYWILKIKYFQKRKGFNNYPSMQPLPSVINMPTYRNSEDNFRRWHSLDDGSFYFCNQFQCEPFSTLNCKSGTNIWSNPDPTGENWRTNWSSLNSHCKMGNSTMKVRMPMMCETINAESCEPTLNSTIDSRNNLENADSPQL